MGKVQSNISFADVEPNPVSKETGFSSTPFEFNSTAITTIWEARDLSGNYGTVVIIGNKIHATANMNIAVNGINTTTIIDDETYTVSSDPLDKVVVDYTSVTGQNARLSVSISASKFEY